MIRTQIYPGFVRTAYRSVIYPPGSCDCGCGGAFALLYHPEIRFPIAVCLTSLKAEAPEQYKRIMELANVGGVGTEYWQG